MRHQSLLLILLTLAVSILGCDSSNPIAPTGSTLTVTANPTQIGLANESSSLTVTGFRPDGNVLNPGTQINLSTDLGVLDSTVLEIDENGRATTQLRPDGQPGTATVTASLPAGDAMATATITIGEDGLQPTLTVQATPNRINIEEDSVISVIARNVDGTFRSGGRVRLRSSLGQLDQENLVTDAQGEAETTLRPQARSGTADITASVDSSMESMTTVTIIQSEVIVDISPRIIDIEDTAEVTVQVRDEDGISLVGGHEVRLTANLGTLDPEVVTTDSRGEATSVYTAGTRAGNDTITAFFGNASDGTDTVDVRTAPAAIILTAGATTIPPEVESTVSFTATVSDAEGLLLSNEVVNFSLQEGVSGTFNPGRTVTTDSGGNAIVSITFQATSVPPVGTRFSVIATARGGITDTVFITVQ